MKEVWQSVKKKLDPKEITESGYCKIVCHVTEIGPARNLFEEPKMSHIQVLHVKRVGPGA